MFKHSKTYEGIYKDFLRKAGLDPVRSLTEEKRDANGDIETEICIVNADNHITMRKGLEFSYPTNDKLPDLADFRYCLEQAVKSITGYDVRLYESDEACYTDNQLYTGELRLVFSV